MTFGINSVRRAVAILEVMWDWNARTSSAGYTDRAPSYYIINKHNFTGSRLYRMLGKQGERYDELLVTNACPELVTSASGRGKPDAEWLKANLEELQPFDLLLVCGRVAQNTYYPAWAGNARVIELPHPAARQWTSADLDFASLIVQEGKHDLSLQFRRGRLVATELIPF